MDGFLLKNLYVAIVTIAAVGVQGLFRIKFAGQNNFNTLQV
jgi:hypothetical protein